ncbi:MAG: aspartate aminotransferase family protein [Deltaproteobacteria bacterium]|nr:aspartate aminotransferase family protein [Deltaproteobacteria bacterium]
MEAFEAPGINTLIGSEGSLAWAEALGSNVLDPDSNLFLDFTAGFGVASIGHRHPRIVEAIRLQTSFLLHGLADVHSHHPRINLAEKLCSLVPVDQPRVYFAVSGSDAVEIALKSAYLATGKPGILAFEPSYHGLTLGALHSTSRPAFRDPFHPFLHDHVHRRPFGAPVDQLKALLAAEPSVGTVIIEPVVGREGVLFPPDGWLQELSQLCRETGALLIADEIFTGFGRTGKLFAVDAEEVRPDLLCCGKALGGGLPIAAVVGSREVMKHWETPGEAMHTATFTANPVACAAALEVLSVISDDQLVQRSMSLGSDLGKRLRDWSLNRAGIRSVRGRGLLWGIELTNRDLARSWSARALSLGLIALAGGPNGNVLQLAPPLTVTTAQIEAALDILEKSWRVLSSETTGKLDP